MPNNEDPGGGADVTGGRTGRGRLCPGGCLWPLKGITILGASEVWEWLRQPGAW